MPAGIEPDWYYRMLYFPPSQPSYWPTQVPAIFPTPQVPGPWTIPLEPSAPEPPSYPHPPRPSTVVPHLCPVCGGKGTVEKTFYDPEAGPGRERCKACGGFGVLYC